ncbi:ATP-binding protein [Terricaulis sp.]|uniref:ATP-binding protein n=1 Tax=Terricaulis sp. TaxID=2768686 RepID=UPI002AC625B2|nr:ATP-binding protein [Terricaulis sp.]MDZ4690940.1 response regulator [Terricaulis sp.]
MRLELSERGLILAPQGRDAQVAAMMLREAGIGSDICTTILDLVDQLEAGAGFVLVTEEALRRADLRPLADWLEAQPEWSDFPFILLTQRGGGLERNPSAARHLKALGNVSFLERPFHPTTLVSMSVSALRGRRRQYEARARLLELSERRQHLTEANEMLEERVRQRTGEVEAAYDKVIEESVQRLHAEEQLRQVQKLEMIGQLTGGVAHDFNNLLTAVLANLSLLQRHLPADDVRAQRWIDGATQGANRGASLTQRLLAFSRRQSLALAPTDVVALVSGMKGLLERSIGPEIDLAFDLTSLDAVSMIDANQVELALLNLAVNARDAMPEGGQLRIGVDHFSGSAPDLPTGDYVRIWVSDTGAGMDADTLERAIDPFFSTKELGKGTGLGLSMVHGLAVQQNGALRLDSAPGAGTRAELFLPVTHERAEDSEAPTPAVAPLTRRSRIMLVDDDALIAMSSVDMLEDLGHEVVEANSGKEALDLLGKVEPIDLLITDFAMPGMTGAQLIDAVRSRFPDLPILLATGYAELPNGKLNDIPRIGKPYTQPQLASEVARLLSSV